MQLIERRALAAAVVAVVSLCALMPGSALAQTPGQIEGALPVGGGFALIVWTGGTPESLVAAAGAQGCNATAGWAAVDGALVGYIHGAPEFVNADFRARFPDGSIPAGTALVLVCSAPGPGAPSPLAIAASEPAVASLPPPAPASLSLEQRFGAATFDAINAARVQAGLGPLNLNLQLRSAAEKYAQLLLDAGRLDHGLDGQPWDRAQREGYPSSIVGEVIASAANSEPLDVQRDTGVLMQVWLNSAPHRAILMSTEFAFADLGPGCATGRNPGGLNLVVCVAMTGQP
jgi:uncharacterized protein YkwD